MYRIDKSTGFSRIKTVSLRLALSLLFAFPCFFNGIYAQEMKNRIHKKSETVDTIHLSPSTGAGKIEVTITFVRGESHNHPTFAVWLEDEEGRFIETLFVTKSFATGIYDHADAGDGTWKKEPGEAIRPAALPYWTHKRNIISRDSLLVPVPENPLPDAITGATPEGSFMLKASALENLPNRFRIVMEINQTWDWNEYWTNNKYPGNRDYQTSAQPSLVYQTLVDINDTTPTYRLLPAGHGHYAGKDGKLYDGLNTLTTALSIAESIYVTIGY